MVCSNMGLVKKVAGRGSAGGFAKEWCRQQLVLTGK